MNVPLQVRKRSDKLEEYQPDKLCFSLQKIAKDKINDSEQNLLISKVEKQIFNNISTTQITEILILTTTAFIEKDPIFDEITTQLLLHKIYREAFGEKFNSENFSELCRRTWKNNLQKMIKEEKIDPRLSDFDLEKLSQVLVFQRDNLFNYLGLKTLYDRYF